MKQASKRAEGRMASARRLEQVPLLSSAPLPPLPQLPSYPCALQLVLQPQVEVILRVRVGEEHGEDRPLPCV